MSCRFFRTTWWMLAGLGLISSLLVARAGDDDQQTTEALWLADHAKLVQKVHTLIVGDVDLKDITLAQAIEFLRRQSKLSDAGNEGINFVLLPDGDSELKGYKFTLKLKKATVEDVLRALPMIAADIGDFVVALSVELEGGLHSRTFAVKDNSLAINPSMLIDKIKQTYDVRSLFEAKGVRFPPGASAVYDLPKKTLTAVYGDSENGVLIEELLVFGFKNVR